MSYPPYPKESQGPCKGCERRTPDCHNAEKCEKWAEFEKRKAERRESMKKSPADGFRKHSYSQAKAIAMKTKK